MKDEELDMLIANAEYEPQQLKDYITNLQEENEILKELNICVGCENNPDYKLRCEKAINFINKTKGFIFNEYEEIITGEVVDADGVLNILEGKNNE